MYEGGEKNGGGFGDDEEAAVADASTMTAADFFGEPSKKLIKKYKAEMNAKVKNGGMKSRGGGNVEKAKGKSFADENDEDSWDDHNFGEDGMDWRNDDENGEEGVDDDDDDGIKDSRKGDRNDNSDDDYEEEMNDEDGKDGIDRVDQRKLSAHEIRSQKLQQQTLRLEEDMMAEKPWRMMGEARGTNRATDSLLDSTPEFEVAFKPPPILTPQHAADIEAMIKKRIIDEDWDDVIPRELPDIGAHKRGGGDAPEVSQEKSKLGLGELYEREYLKKTAGYDRDAHEKQTEEDAAKEEMKRLFANLCSQLDALSNYHFAPRPVADEVEVQNREDVPAIAMEEVLPLHVSRSRGIAPEEVHAAGKGRKSVLKGESELDQAERKRLRNAKKAARRKSRQQKHADERLISKLQPGLGLNNPYEKRKLREELQMARASGKVVVAAENGGQWKDEAASGKEYQTSTKFFAKMQENVDSMIHGDDGVGNGRAKKKRKGLEAGHASSVYRL
jgi:U3 small nucleolar RNA-associated protein MPP10